MKTIFVINKGVMFFLELAMLAAFAYAGYHATRSMPGAIALAISLPVLAAVLWGIYAAPKSKRRLPMPYRGLFAIVIFWTAGILLFRTGAKTSGITILAVSLIVMIIETFFDNSTSGK